MCIFSGVHLSSMSRKIHGYDPHIFIFILVNFMEKFHLKLRKKALRLWEKLCLLMLFDLFLKMVFKGERVFSQSSELLKA